MFSVGKRGLAVYENDTFLTDNYQARDC